MPAWSDKAKKGESGLPDDFIATVRQARYGFPFEENPESCNLVLKIEQNVDGQLDDQEIRLGVGDFEPGDKEGTFAIHSSQNEDKHFGRRSKVHRFITSALEAGVPLEDRQDPSRAKYEEKDALIWEGLILRIKVEEEEGTFRQGPDKGKSFTSRVPLVTEYLGTVDNPVESSAKSPDDNGDGGDKEEQAKKLAKSSGNYLEYLENVTSKLSVTPNDDLAKESFYDSARS